MDLKTFLLARIEEDEEVARDATAGPWKWWNLERVDQGWSDNGPNLQQTSNEWKSCPYYCRWAEGDVNHRGEQAKPGHEHRVTEEVIGSWGSDAHGISIEKADALHIATHDPARILAECAAKRAITEMHAPISLPGVRGKEQGCPLCGNYERGYGWETVGPCATLKSLAAVYADHTDYQPEWKL